MIVNYDIGLLNGSCYSNEMGEFNNGAWFFKRRCTLIQS